MRSMSSVLSWALLLVQFGLCATLAVRTAGSPWTLPAIAMLAAALALAAWAVGTMGFRQLNALPEVLPGAALRTHGAYRWIRHPMYSSLLLGAAACVAARPDTPNIACAVVLALDLVVKAAREERHLRAAFPDYAAYRRRSWSLIPWIY